MPDANLVSPDLEEAVAKLITDVAAMQADITALKDAAPVRPDSAPDFTPILDRLTKLETAVFPAKPADTTATA